MAPQKNLALLSKQMEGQNSIHDYDVVVSYNQEELNKFLLDRAAEVGTPTSTGLQWVEHTKNDFDEEDFTNYLEVAFSKPSLQILDQEGNIYFTALMTGSKRMVRDRDQKEKTTKIENVMLVISTRLAAVRGTTNAAGKFTPDSSPDPSGANDVRIIEPGHDTALGVCINFESLMSVDFYNYGEGGNTPDDLNKLTSLIKAEVERRFKDSGFQYCLAGLNNEKPKDPGDSIVLQPAHFTFSVVHGDDESTSAICMAIILKDNTRAGPKPPPFYFTPGGEQVNPIPTECTASIIFSHRVMAGLFIMPGFKGVTNPECESQTGDAGMKFTLNLPSHEIKADDFDDTTSVGVSSHLDGFSFNLNSPKTKVDIAATNSTSTPPIKFSYASKTLNMGWNHSTPGPYGRFEHGAVDLDFTFTGTAAWTQGPNPEEHPNQLGMVFSFASELGVEVKAKDHTIWEKLCGASNALPPHAKDIKPKAPELSIDMSPMDFFLTTNLLFPSEHIFHMDDPGQTTDRKGLMTPRDTILTGTIKRGPASARKLAEVK